MNAAWKNSLTSHFG